jgi:cytochrome d ubiquinol oxidase subunit II
MIELVPLKTGFLHGWPLAELWFVVVFAFLATFLFLDGMDFGVGALFATRDDHHDKETMLSAVAPIWDGNEVWLIVFGGALFAAFPEVYANLFSRHYLPLFAVLVALILRGLAPEFYEQREDATWQRYWGGAFIVGSIGAPFLLGVFAAAWIQGAAGPTIAGLVVGLALVALTIVNGAAFLGLKTTDDLQAEMSTYGVRAAIAYLILAVLSIAALALSSGDLMDKLLAPVPAVLVVATAAGVGGYVLFVRREQYRAALGVAAVLTYGLTTLVAVLLYPTIDPAVGLTVEEAAVSSLALSLMTVFAAILLPLVSMYFVVLYSSFAGPAEAGEGY